MGTILQSQTPLQQQASLSSQFAFKVKSHEDFIKILKYCVMYYKNMVKH